MCRLHRRVDRSGRPAQMPLPACRVRQVPSPTACHSRPVLTGPHPAPARRRSPNPVQRPRSSKPTPPTSAIRSQSNHSAQFALVHQRLPPAAPPAKSSSRVSPESKPARHPVADATARCQSERPPAPLSDELFRRRTRRCSGQPPRSDPPEAKR